MGGQTEEKKPKKHICVGLLAHVDAGKTTLSESILYHTGAIRTFGRVDHGNTFLDTDDMERLRGITIFSKQARFCLDEKQITLLDTPGHVDFSAEMERTLMVLDYGIMVINGSDGVQSHTLTLWKLLSRYGIPVFLFINKMDQAGTDKDLLMSQLQEKLDEHCIDFGNYGEISFWEELAMCNEDLMEEYVNQDCIENSHIRQAVRERQVFPCYFGSALKAFGVQEFLRGLSQYLVCPSYPDQFAARVFKITRDSSGNRLTHMKIMGGTLKVKEILTNQKTDGEKKDNAWEEKADQIRLYSGNQFQLVKEAEAGAVCTVSGLTKTFAGEGLGAEASLVHPMLIPVLTYQISLPAACNQHDMLLKLRQLEEEEPQLHIVWKEAFSEIHVQVMGEIELEILRALILERYGVLVEFLSGSIIYQETIAEAVEGVGHFEPLRHYAEVHLLMEPLEPGSGIILDSCCSEDMLSRNWQRLVLTHLEEKTHRGVLTGSEITDMKITLVSGKAHQKHTEGGDFRQATYRAVRQGLRKAKSILLEPVYEFQLELPTQLIGRAMADIQKMNGIFAPPTAGKEMSVITGTAPVAAMKDYQKEVTAYSKGLGRLFCSIKGYEPCKNANVIIKEIGYDPDKDLDHPCDSVFCSHGAGFIVNWQDVEQYMHLESIIKPDSIKETSSRQKKSHTFADYGDEKELEEIFQRTYGTAKRERYQPVRRIEASKKEDKQLPWNEKYVQRKEQYLLVDGYNIIFAWKDLKEIAKDNLDGARDRLIEILENYQGYKKHPVIVVFDAYKVSGGVGSVTQQGGVHVIYTKEAETADQYIEKTVSQLAKEYDITVATSDQLVQMIIWGDGAKRLSAMGLKEEIDGTGVQIREICLGMERGKRNYPFEDLKNQILSHDLPRES